VDLFVSDLDNTLIYSYKRDIGPQKRLVEVKEGKELSFMTEYSCRLLCQIADRCCFVPATTRSLEQYGRIRFFIGTAGSPSAEGDGGEAGGSGRRERKLRSAAEDGEAVGDSGCGERTLFPAAPEYALVSNGGNLLRRGVPDNQWYEDSLRLCAPAEECLKEAERLLAADPRVNFDVRRVDGLFVFTKSDDPQGTMAGLRAGLDSGNVRILNNGSKIYVLPGALDKGTALLRLRKLLGAELVLAAGDSEFDVPLLLAADEAWMPRQLYQAAAGSLSGMDGRRLHVLPGDGLFSDLMLTEAAKRLGIACRQE